MRRLAVLVVVVLLPSLLLVGGAGGSGVKRRIGGWRPDTDAAERYAKRRAGDVRFSLIRLDGKSLRFNAGRSAPMASIQQANC